MPQVDGFAGWHRWEVHVGAGEVVLCDEYDDPLEQHIATVIAAGVPRTVCVETHRRDTCPRHRVRAWTGVIPGVEAVGVRAG